MAACPSSSWARQQWQLASAVGPDLLLGSLGCGTLLPTPSGRLHTTSPGPLPGTDPLSQFSGCGQRVSGCGVLGGGTSVSAALLLLCPLQSSCCALLPGFEVPPSQPISLLVQQLPRVWVPFLFHSSLSGVLILS